MKRSAPKLNSRGCVRYRLEKPWKDGTDAVLLDPLDFIGRLCALSDTVRGRAGGRPIDD